MSPRMHSGWSLQDSHALESLVVQIYSVPQILYDSSPSTNYWAYESPRL